MIHPADAPIAYAAVMAHGGFKGLTLSAHGVGGGFPPLFFLRHRRAGYGSRVGEGCFGMTCQCHGAEKSVNHSEDGVDALRDCEEGDRDGGVGHEEPDEGGHDGSGLVSGVHPDSIFFGGAEGEGPGGIVVRVDVMLTGSSYARERLRVLLLVVIAVGDDRFSVFVIFETVFEVFRGVYLTATGGGEARAQDGRLGRR